MTSSFFFFLHIYIYKIRMKMSELNFKKCCENNQDEKTFNNIKMDKKNQFLHICIVFFYLLYIESMITGVVTF